MRDVFFLDCRADAKAHELATQRDVARGVARLLGARYQGDLGLGAMRPRDGYVVPNDTLVSLAAAERLGITHEAHLFGGVVPHAFVATKVISHGRVTRDAAAPDAWTDAFAASVHEVVLPGYSAFTADDARAAGRALLAGGPLRVKAAGSSGGTGQAIVRDEAELETALEQFAGAIAQDGVVLERDLACARTYSIGLLHLPGLVASYVGTQENTPDNAGNEVYGGSTITLYRGGFDELERQVAEGDLRQAVALARRYHEAALAFYAGMIASRANYDVVLGQDAEGRPLAGVLEQSWRIGGASGAEMAALQALRDEPGRTHARASTVERYGDATDAPPAHARVIYDDTDPQCGRMIKYTVSHADDGGA